MLQATRSLMMVVAAGGLLVACGEGTERTISSPASASLPDTVVAADTLPTAPTDVATSVMPTVASAAAASPEDVVKFEFLAALGVRERCDYDPSGCDYGSISITDSEMDRFTRDTMKTYVGANLRAVRGNGGLQIRVESVAISAEVASVVTCAYDTAVIFDVGRSPKAFDDIVFDNHTRSDRVRWELRQSDGRWLIVLGARLQTLTEGDLCEFSLPSP